MTDEHAGVTRVQRRTLSAWILLICGLWLVGLGVYFMFLRPALLPEDLRYIGKTLSDLDAVLPGLHSWLRRVFTVMGAFISATGILTVFVVTTASPRGGRMAGIVLAIVGLLSVITMSATNFVIDSDFKWLLVVPALLWVVGIAIYFREVACARHA